MEHPRVAAFIAELVSAVKTHTALRRGQGAVSSSPRSASPESRSICSRRVWLITTVCLMVERMIVLGRDYTRWVLQG